MNRSERGQALLEFTFMIPFVMIFLFGALEFAAVFLQAQRMAALSREAANAVYRDCSFYTDDGEASACADGVMARLAAQSRLTLSDFDTRATLIASVYRTTDGETHLVSRPTSGGGGHRHLVTDSDLDPAVLNLNGLSVIAEAFYRWQPLTPLENLMNGFSIPRDLHETTVYA